MIARLLGAGDFGLLTPNQVAPLICESALARAKCGMFGFEFGSGSIDGALGFVELCP